MQCGYFKFSDEDKLTNLIDISVEKMWSDCDILRKKEFLDKYPLVDLVAIDLHKAAENSILENGQYKPFNELGIDNIQGFIQLLEWNNAKAIKLYKGIRDIIDS